MTPLFVAFAGSLGAACRFVLDGHLKVKYDHSFPWGTVIINISGSLALGVMTGYAFHHHAAAATAIIGVGFCGGYTTFSTASFETVRLLERKAYWAAIANAAGTLLAAALAACIGIYVGSWM